VPELVAKTVAVMPDPALRGLGAWLVEDIHKRAADHGFRIVYHALMHEANDSANITAGAATVVRRYRLYVRKS
jgi:GNAT superfamily N-acetyltransferase